MKRIHAGLVLVLAGAMMSIACTSVPPVNMMAGNAVIIRLAGQDDLKAFNTMSGNPFVEYKSFLIKNKYRFEAFRIDAGSVPNGYFIKSLGVYSGDKPVQTKVLYQDDLLDYWTTLSLDDGGLMETRRTIERYVPVSSHIMSRKRASTRYIVVLVQDLSGAIDGWKATITVNGGDLEFSGSM